jgi:Zn finger protein HypA/HybF involved in hydrogenase expression
VQDPSPEVKTRAIKILTGVAICEALLIDNGYSIEDRTLVCRVAATRVNLRRKQLEHEHKEAIRNASFRRNYCCHKCGSAQLDIRDGKEVGGMPGINYKVCSACGWSYPIVKRRTRRSGTHF